MLALGHAKQASLIYCYLDASLIVLPLPSSKATPRLSEDKVKQCIDPRLKGDYPSKGVAKVSLLSIYLYALMFFLAGLDIRLIGSC